MLDGFCCSVHVDKAMRVFESKQRGFFDFGVFLLNLLCTFDVVLFAVLNTHTRSKLITSKILSPCYKSEEETQSRG